MNGHFSAASLLIVPLWVAATLGSSPAVGDVQEESATAIAASRSAPASSEVPDDAFDCLIEPTSLIELGSSLQGVVARRLVARGESVTRGQPIVELESSVEAAVLEQAEARAEMTSEVQAREAEFALAKLDFARIEEMHDRQLAPEQQLDEASARRQIAAAKVVQAIETQRLMLLDVQRMRRELERRTLLSPVDGVVLEHLVDVGELVRDNPVARIARLDPLRVEVVLPGRLFGTLEPGRGARVYPEFRDGPPLVTTIDVVDPMLDAQSGTFGAQLTLANADFAIAGGQRCRIAFEAAPAIAAAVGRVGASGDAVTGGGGGRKLDAAALPKAQQRSQH